MLKFFLESLIKSIVDKPDEIKINEVEGQKVTIFELRVDKEDFGKVLGKHGQNIKSIRILLGAVAAKEGKHTVLEIIE